MTFKKDQTLSELNQLFESCPPARLRKSITTLLFQFLRGSSTTDHVDFHDMMTDIQYLIEFLDGIDSKVKKV